MKRTWNNVIYLFAFFFYLFGAPLIICQSDAVDILYTGIRNSIPKTENIEPATEAVSCSESLYSELAPCNTSNPQLITEEYSAVTRSRHFIPQRKNLNMSFDDSNFTKEQLTQNHLKNIRIQPDTLQ